MWRAETTAAQQLPDLVRFLDVINAHSSFFTPQAPIVIARAPGRLDLMGGIADYSGSLVLQLPLAVATYVAAQPVDEPVLTIRSTAASEIGGLPTVSIPLASLAPSDHALPYADAHALLTADVQKRWAAYVAGVPVVLQHERNVRLERGVRLLVHSDVPTGKGVSSSAALEVATMQALCTVYGLHLEGRDLALLCQKVENVVVGAPCGVMDQMTSACGQQDRLLALRCQPAELERSVPLPPHLEVWGIDSGLRHAVSGSDYGAVRVGAFMGYRILADLAGLPASLGDRGDVTIEDGQWHGYLANVPPSLWESRYAQHVPAQLDGAAFIERFGGFTDTITVIDPQQSYAVRQPTAHPIYEHHRVRLFRSLLEQAPSIEQGQLLGELMYQSHASYGACGLGSDGTDRLVALVQEAGSDSGLLGAKITGGGSGGTVAMLAQRGAADAVQTIAERYADETGHQPLVLHGSSPGAIEFGVARLVAEA